MKPQLNVMKDSRQSSTFSWTLLQLWTLKMVNTRMKFSWGASERDGRNEEGRQTDTNPLLFKLLSPDCSVSYHTGTLEMAPAAPQSWGIRMAWNKDFGFCLFDCAKVLMDKACPVLKCSAESYHASWSFPQTLFLPKVISFSIECHKRRKNNHHDPIFKDFL